MALAAGPAPSQIYAQPAGITAAELFSDRDIPALGSGLRLRWLPPTRDYIAAHSAQPEHPDMRAECSIWLRSLLASEWLPGDVPELAPYLRQGTGRESRATSAFFAAYRVEDAW